MRVAARQKLTSFFFSAADLQTLIPVATSWLGIAVFTDGQWWFLYLPFRPGS